MKFKLKPVFCGLVRVEFEDGSMTAFLDIQKEADMRLCGMIHELANSGLECRESYNDNPGFMEIVAKSADWTRR